MPNAQMLNMLNMLNTPNTPMDSGWTGPSLYLGREIGWWASKLAVLAGWLVGWLAGWLRKKGKKKKIGIIIPMPYFFPLFFHGHGLDYLLPTFTFFPPGFPHGGAGGARPDPALRWRNLGM